MSSSGRWIRAERRLAIYLRDGWWCGGCGRDLEDLPARMVTLDHIVPRSRGGTHRTHNLYACCHDCNSRRGSASLVKAFGADRARNIRNRARRSLRRHLARARRILRPIQGATP